jgi:hypothetical protein
MKNIQIQVRNSCEKLAWFYLSTLCADYIGPNRLNSSKLYNFYCILLVQSFTEIRSITSYIIMSDLWAEKL